VNIATEAAADIHLLLQGFPKPFRAIAEARSNFPCLFPAHPEQRAALGHTLLEDLGLGKLHPLKLRSKTGLKTFSMEGYANKLLLHYLKEIRRIREELLSFRLNDPWASAAIPWLEIERLDEEIPLSASTVKPWMDVIWQLLLKDLPQPESHDELKRLGHHRRQRTITSRFTVKARTRAANIRHGIKSALGRYLVRMVRLEERKDRDK
jgi:hypothetical protein